MARARTIHAVLVNVTLVIVALFYLTAPAVYAYFSEVDMGYSRGPKWLAVLPAAVVTARLFDSYNANTPRAARFNRQLTCFLADDGAKRMPGCLHELHAGQTTYGPPTLKLSSGSYVAHWEFAALNTCSAGEARLEVLTTGQFGRVLARYTGPIAPDEWFDVPFRLRLMDAALAPVEFRVSGISGCVLLSRADWTAPPHGARDRARK